MRGDKAPATLADCDTGDIVRCHAGLLKVGPRLAGALICRLVESVEGAADLYRECSPPISFADRTAVIERLRDRSWYVTRRPSGGDVDPDPVRGNS